MKTILSTSLFLTLMTSAFAASNELSGLKFSLYFSRESVDASKVVVFACRNIVNNRFLVNKAGTKACWIKNPADHTLIYKKLGMVYDRMKLIAAERCPESFATKAFCDPSKLRSF